MLDAPVIGFRSWRFHWRQPSAKLDGAIKSYTWARGTNTAECLRHRSLHRESLVPAPNCGCGLYAYHTLDIAKDGFGGAPVLGVVRGWGHMQVHSQGWRAEHAEILALIEGSGHPAFVQAAAEHYRVPLLPRRSAALLAEAEFGQVIPEDMRPATDLIDPHRGRDYRATMLGVACGGYLAGAYAANKIWKFLT